MSSLDFIGLNINYEVTDLVRTMDFYNILFGESPGVFYKKHAAYIIKSLLLTISFTQNPKAAQPACGHFSLLFSSNEEVYIRFLSFIRKGFMNTVTINPDTFSPNNHSFTIKD